MQNKWKNVIKLCCCVFDFLNWKTSFFLEKILIKTLTNEHGHLLWNNSIIKPFHTLFRTQLWIINTGLQSFAYKIKSIRCYSMNLQVMRYTLGANSICSAYGVCDMVELIYYTFGCKWRLGARVGFVNLKLRWLKSSERVSTQHFLKR